MIDLHSHVLPGLDDGAEDLLTAVEMCRAAAADGVTILAATPHVREDFPTTPDQMLASLEELRRAAGAMIRLLPGGEIDLEELAMRSFDELAGFALAGNASYLLLETPYTGWPLGFGAVVEQLRGRGVTAVIAHPERNWEVQENVGLLTPLVNAGALVQLTAASVDGRLGRRTQECSFDLLEHRLAHLVASDAHSPEVRGIGLSGAVAALGDGGLARWSTDLVPRAIVDGTALPPRPDWVRPRRRRSLFRRRD